MHYVHTLLYIMHIHIFSIIYYNFIIANEKINNYISLRKHKEQFHLILRNLLNL